MINLIPGIYFFLLNLLPHMLTLLLNLVRVISCTVMLNFPTMVVQDLRCCHIGQALYVIGSGIDGTTVHTKAEWST